MSWRACAICRQYLRAALLAPEIIPGFQRQGNRNAVTLAFKHVSALRFAHQLTHHPARAGGGNGWRDVARRVWSARSAQCDLAADMNGISGEPVHDADASVPAALDSAVVMPDHERASFAAIVANADAASVIDHKQALYQGLRRYIGTSCIAVENRSDMAI